MAKLPDGIKKTREKKLEIANRCPYIGLAYDPYTVFSNPTQWNRCFHVKRASQVALAHQTSHCLTPGYLECEVYIRNLTNSLPKAIRLNQYDAIKKEYFLNQFRTDPELAFFGGVTFLVGFFEWFFRVSRGRIFKSGTDFWVYIQGDSYFHRLFHSSKTCTLSHGNFYGFFAISDSHPDTDSLTH